MALAAALVACAVAGATTGCSRESGALKDIEEAYAQSDFEETVALCKYAIRRGRDTPPVYFYYGAALVSLGRDFEGFNQLDNAISRELSQARRAADFLHGAALADVARGDRSKAARRLQKAVEYDPSIDLGPFRFLVADVYFGEENYGRAAPIYRDAIAAYPDTSILEAAYFNLATSYDEMGWNEQALEAYQKVLELYPRGEHKSESAWKVATLMYESAEKQQVLGNYEDAVETLTALADYTNNRGMLQKAHFLLGETYEAMGDYASAYGAYREVIDVDRGASGRIVERAREKIAALQKAGLN